MECCHVCLNQHSKTCFFFAKLLVTDYRHQDDETVASRGSISMKMAMLRDAERTRFEIHSVPSRSHHQHAGSQKWFMKANHPVEARRWTQAIAKSIEWYKMRDGADSDTSSIIAGGSSKRIKSTRRKSVESDSSMMRTTPSMHSQSLSGFWKKNSHGNGSTMRDQDSDLDVMDASPDLSREVGPSEQNIADKEDHEEEDGDDTSSAANSENKSPPHPTIDLQANAAAAQLELTVQMVENLSSSATTTAVPFHLRETLSALLDSLQTTQTLLSEYTSMGQSRDGWYARQLRKERARQDVWEESLRVVVKEGENLEQELRKRSRNRGSRVFSASPAGTITGGLSDGKKRRPSALGFITAPEIVAEESPSPISDGEPPASAITPTESSSPPIIPTSVPAAPRMPPSRRGTVDTFVGPIPAITIDGDYDDFLAKAVTEGDYDHDTDEEDEFFDAIEANALPNMLVYEALTSPSAKSPEASKRSFANQQEQSLISMKANQGFYAGYAHMRTSLKLSAERPNASLWSVLKHSIGKDLTKISFPVFFNEPTSMLQRMVRFSFFFLSVIFWVGVLISFFFFWW